eukprot:GAHX01001288.1.p1 GENE.GAHX01001288.1~~GAHX01001288.1.p1  ORF type:complete len:898 (+),score=218.73 GAHX01001288.1:32-2725(+)
MQQSIILPFYTTIQPLSLFSNIPQDFTLHIIKKYKHYYVLADVFGTCLIYNTETSTYQTLTINTMNTLYLDVCVPSSMFVVLGYDKVVSDDDPDIIKNISTSLKFFVFNGGLFEEFSTIDLWSQENIPATPSAFAINSSLTRIAIGFEDGSIMLIDKIYIKKNGEIKFKTKYFNNTDNVIKQLCFSDEHLYELTKAGVYRYNCRYDSHTAELVKEEVQNGHLFYSKMEKLIILDSNFICYKDYKSNVISNDNSNVEDKFVYKHLKGDKKNVVFINNRIVFVLKNKINELVVYNVENGSIEYKHVLNLSEKTIKDVFIISNESNQILLLSPSLSCLFRLKEADLEQKVELLCVKYKFVEAIDIIKRSEEAHNELLSEVYKKQAISMFKENNKEKAIGVFAECISLNHLQMLHVLDVLIKEKNSRYITELLFSLKQKNKLTEAQTNLLISNLSMENEEDKLLELINEISNENTQLLKSISSTVYSVCNSNKVALTVARLCNDKLNETKLLLQYNEIEHIIELLNKTTEEELVLILNSLSSQLFNKLKNEIPSLLLNLVHQNKLGYKEVLSLSICFFSTYKLNKATAYLLEILDTVFSTHDLTGVENSVSFWIAFRLFSKLCVSITVESKYVETFKNVFKIDKSKTRNILTEFGLNSVLIQIYDEVEMYTECLELHIIERAPAGEIIKLCRKYEQKFGAVWVVALKKYFGKSEYFSGSINLEELLENTVYNEKISLIEALDILSMNKNIKIESLKIIIKKLNEKLSSKCEEEERSIKEANHLMGEFNADFRKEGDCVVNIGECSICELDLEYPFVYFRCGHGYHSECFNKTRGGDKKEKCVLCMINENNIKYGQHSNIRRNSGSGISSQDESSENEKIKIVKKEKPIDKTVIKIREFIIK